MVDRGLCEHEACGQFSNVVIPRDLIGHRSEAGATARPGQCVIQPWLNEKRLNFPTPSFLPPIASSSSTAPVSSLNLISFTNFNHYQLHPQWVTRRVRFHALNMPRTSSQLFSPYATASRRSLSTRITIIVFD